MDVYPDNEKMCNGDTKIYLDDLLQQGLLRKDNPANNSVSSLLQLDSKLREISSGTLSAIPIFGIQQL
jgi:hypothetical protein